MEKKINICLWVYLLCQPESFSCKTDESVQVHFSLRGQEVKLNAEIQIGEENINGDSCCFFSNF